MSIKKFRKKPVVITAIQFDGKNTNEVLEFCQKVVEMKIYKENLAMSHPMCRLITHLDDQNTITIRTLEGDMTARKGDWIICGVAGEFYPCKPDIFKETYEPLEEN